MEVCRTVQAGPSKEDIAKKLREKEKIERLQWIQKGLAEDDARLKAYNQVKSLS